jgi:N-acyl homoserine lactone hydrolase
MCSRSISAMRAAIALMAVLICLASMSNVQAAAGETSTLRLYTLDCGRAVFSDMSMFSDADDYDGQAGELADPCFLIQHGRSMLLWDTGLGDKIAAHPEGVDFNGIRFHVDVTLENQLKMLGLSPADIQFVGFSHFHVDHVGNANLFTRSTWIINRSELNAALAPVAPAGVDKSLISGYEHVQTKLIEDDYDVFGDGTVRILRMPGHTSGHQALMLKLAKEGVVILSGDLYHTLDNRRLRRVPRINVQRADTLASMDRFEHLVTNTHARVIVQHSPEDFRSLPKFPRYLD